MSNNVDNSEHRSIVGRLFNIILYAILVLPMIIIGIGWYYSLSREGKRKFWIVVVALLILSWLWNILLDSPLFRIESESY